MTINFESALGPHAAALQLRSQRTQILASNIANADTPGFQARDIDFKTMLAQRLPGNDQTLAGEHNKHIVSTPNANSHRNALLYRVPLMPSIDGNTVDGQTEQAAFAENNLQFQAAFQFLNRRFQGLILAIKGE